MKRDSDQNPCGVCQACMDSTHESMNIIEIDGASNNSVDDIRQVISNLSYLPTTGEYKVYIIDEVHMLSTSAFNALLKSLEEPPAHIKFFLQPQNLKKFCQRFFLDAREWILKNAQMLI